MPNAVTEAETLISEIIPATEVDKLEHGREAEILQPLLDLGYIKKAKKANLANGIRLFRKDYLSLNLIPEFAPKFLFLPATDLEGEELNLLHTLTALDGDFTLDILPQKGEINLCSRILHYRLSIHQLISFGVEKEFSSESLEAMTPLHVWIKNLPSAPLDLINLLGNIPALIQFINIDKNGGLNERIVAFKYQKEEAVSRFNVDISDDLNQEIEEDEQEEEEDNESDMLLLENEVDDHIDELQKETIFDRKEDEALKKDTRKNRKKRSRLIKVQAMIDVVLAKMNKISDEINIESDLLSKEINKLKKIQTTVSKEANRLTRIIQNFDKQIDQLEKSKKGLKKKERQLKRKIRRGAPQDEIDRRRQEIKKIKNANREIENLVIKKSTINVQLIPVDEDLRIIENRLNSFEKQMTKLIEEREQRINEKQKKLVALLKRLNNLKDKVDKIKFSFRGRLKKVLNEEFYLKEVQEGIFQNRNRNKLKTISEEDYNNFLIRLIQIFQWTNGFYYGKLDNKVGNRTFSSLDDMVTYSKGLRLKFILSRLSENQSGTKGYWILNIKYLFKKLSDNLLNVKADFTTKDLLEHYEKQVLKIESKGKKVGNEITDRCYGEIVEENQSDIQEDGTIRRIYYGIKNIATTLFDALNDLISIIKSGIEKLIYLLKNLIKIVYKEIREGVRKFKDGMIFLFGKRQFATPVGIDSAIITKFDFDFDAITFAPPQVSKKEMKIHTETLLRFSNNLNFSLVLTGKILKWALKLIDIGTPIGWAKLSLRIAIQYKRMIIEWLVKLGKDLTRHVISIKYKKNSKGTT